MPHKPLKLACFVAAKSQASLIIAFYPQLWTT
jgi:hypothetical protein